jgi:hypothetical protein
VGMTGPRSSLWSLAVTGLWVAAAAGGVPGYGAAEFVPAPATAVGFRADGCGWYPGATPPVQWWEGTPTRLVLRISRGQTDRYNPERDKNSKPVAVWGLADGVQSVAGWWPAPGRGASLTATSFGTSAIQ